MWITKNPAISTRRSENFFRGHGVTVAQKPSKLLERVRVPLPAPYSNINFLKEQVFREVTLSD